MRAVGQTNAFEPFTHDSWLEVGAYLSPRNLYQISCVSKSLNSLVWSDLIPSSGMTFGPQVPLATIEKYLSRIPRLKHLDLSDHPASAYELLSHLTQLDSLATPFSDPTEGRVGFRESRFYHLRDFLTSLRAGVVAQEMREIPTFHKLKHLCIPERLTDDDHVYSRHLTGIESLTMPGVDVDKITWLTNLIDLHLTSTPDFNSPLKLPMAVFTRLKSLKIDWGFTSEAYILEGFEHLTNLEVLHMSDSLRTRAEFIDICTRTGLKELQFREASSTAPIDMDIHLLSKLTNLTQLSMTVGREVDLPSCLPGLSTSLTELTVWGTPVGDENALSAIGLLSNLKKLSVHSLVDNPLWALTKMVNLTDLSVRFAGPASGIKPNSFRYLESLTNLQTLSAKVSANMVDTSSLTNITCLHWDTYTYHLPTLPPIPGLRKLILGGFSQRYSLVFEIGQKYPSLEMLEFLRGTGIKKKEWNQEIEVLKGVSVKYLTSLTNLECIKPYPLAMNFWNNTAGAR